MPRLTCVRHNFTRHAGAARAVLAELMHSKGVPRSTADLAIAVNGGGKFFPMKEVALIKRQAA